MGCCNVGWRLHTCDVDRVIASAFMSADGRCGVLGHAAP